MKRSANNSVEDDSTSPGGVQTISLTTTEPLDLTAFNKWLLTHSLTHSLTHTLTY